ncbi:MAG: DUF47 family protein, partial [Nitrosopumilus sp.]
MGGREATMVLLDENGIRCDGRKIDETRKITIKAGVLKNADGSAYIEFGDNKILVGIFGPRDVHPKHMSDTDTGILRVRYHMEPFSVTERKNPAPSRREIEISLYEKALIPESRGDILGLLEAVDRIPNKAESVAFQMQTE